jgi:hypothetical protein
LGDPEIVVDVETTFSPRDHIQDHRRALPLLLFFSPEGGLVADDGFLWPVSDPDAELHLHTLLRRSEFSIYDVGHCGVELACRFGIWMWYRRSD